LVANVGWFVFKKTSPKNAFYKSVTSFYTQKAACPEPAHTFVALFHQPNKVMKIRILASLLLLQSFVSCQQSQEKALALEANAAPQTADADWLNLEKSLAPATNIVFQSADGGQSWQDISTGLPADLQADGLLVGDGALYLCGERGMYRSSTAAAPPVWKREISLDDRSSIISAGTAGMFALSRSGHFFKKTNGTDAWMPTFANFQNKSVRTVFEALDGTVFIGCDNGIFKSIDQGKTWKHVFEHGWVIKMVESDGVLLCTNQQGILRSTDGGEHWDVVVREGGVGIAVERIAGGFAAITYNTESKSRRVRISEDGGKTWQPIDAGLRPHASIASIKQVGEYFYCGHPDGIFRSADRGKTWQLILPAVEKKVFNLSVSGDVIYAVAQNEGC
jgi:photosystem II stability/assembly factor-like uncharacterized protein